MIFKIPKNCRLCNFKLELTDTHKCRNCKLYRILYSYEDRDYFIADSDGEVSAYEEINFTDLMLHAVNVYCDGFAEIYKLDSNLKIILNSRIEIPFLDFSNIQKLKSKLKTITTFR